MRKLTSSELPPPSLRFMDSGAFTHQPAQTFMASGQQHDHHEMTREHVKEHHRHGYDNLVRGEELPALGDEEGTKPDLRRPADPRSRSDGTMDDEVRDCE